MRLLYKGEGRKHGTLTEVPGKSRASKAMAFEMLILGLTLYGSGPQHTHNWWEKYYCIYCTYLSYRYSA